MTEYWKSNPMYWCELCRVWMNDTKAAKLNHERGSKHQENLQRKLRDMSKKADAEKKEAEQAAAAISNIERAAQARFQADQRAAHEAAGRWDWMEASQYYYNSKHRWYYDPKTQWYYGGEPVAWTQKPGLPSAAMFGVAPHAGGPVEQQPSSSAAAAAGGGAGGSAANGGSSKAGGSSVQQAAAAAAAATGQRVVVKKTVMQLPSHPQSTIGGHQMPTAGRIGGLKGVGADDDEQPQPVKRKREEGGGVAAKAAAASKKPLDPAEAEALARREAARKRVEDRTKAAFGLT